MQQMFVLLALASAAETEANPIRRIVGLLQGMQTEIEGEGVRAKEMYEKYMCFCDTNIAQTQKELEEGGATISRLETSVKELVSANAQIDQELADLGDEVKDNRASIEEQSSVRQEEAKKFLDESSETKNAIASIDKALPALKKGLSLTQTVELLTAMQPLVKNSIHEDEMRSLLQETQSSSEGVTGGADQIIGILQQMSDNFKENLKEIIQDEEEAIARYDDLVKSKNEEFQSANNEMNARKERRSQNSEAISANKIDLVKGRNAFATNQDRIVDLKKGCGDRTLEYDTASKNRQIEVTAIGEAVKILNDDSALDLFKKTLPSPALVQEKQDPAAQVWQLLQGSAPNEAPSFVQLTLRGGAKPGFGPVLKLVGDMKRDLAKQQDDEFTQLNFCKDEIARNENVKTEGEGQVKLLTQELAEMANRQSALQETIDTLNSEVDKMVAALEESTKRRAEEKAEYTKVSAEQTQAIALIEKAKGVLGGVYGAKAALVQKDQKDEEMSSMLGLSFVQTGEESGGLDQLLLEVGRDAGLAAGGSYQPKVKQGAGIMAIMDEMKHDVEMELAEVHHDEEEQQADFDQLTKDTNAAEKDKKKEITAKKESKAKIDELIAIRKKALDGYADAVTIVSEKLKALHDQCDFLLENYDDRKKKRAQEIDGLSSSEAVLRGAKLDLAQRSLRH